MKYEIKDRWDGKILYADEAESFKALVEAAVKARANLDGADLTRANLTRANLTRANLDGANLDGANLTRANLTRANLDGADLYGANLYGADLARANLDGANLTRANLTRARLTRANLDGANKVKISPETRIETGETWKEYLEQVVPALLTAGGKSIEEVATKKNWSCHSWDNCPMAEAFNVHDINKVPILLRSRANQFIKYFDAGLIPMPKCEASRG